MSLKDMKNNLPETPEFIHTMIQNEVKKQLQETKAIDIVTKRVKKWTGSKVAAAVAACVLATSTISYAGVRLYHMYFEKQGTYSYETGIKTDDSTGKFSIPGEIHDIDISSAYIPKGMKWIDESHLEYPEHKNTGGFSFASVILDNDDLDKVMQEKNVVDCEKKTFGNYEGVYLKYHDITKDGSFNQRIYLLCPDVYRVLTVYIGDDVSKEDAMKVVENLKITENETMIETKGLYTWSEMVTPEEITGGEISTSVSEHQLPIHKMGETFTISASGEDSDGNYVTENNISVCVDSIKIKDDLQLIDQKHVPEEWKGAVGTDGKLVNNTLSYIKSGDGIESVDEIVKTEDVKQKLVYATVTYTNQSDKKINHMLYLGSLMLMNHKDGKYQIYDPKEQSGDGYDRVTWNGIAHTAEMTYSSVSENYGNGGNYIFSLKPGESMKVNMAWVVNEEDLDHMYLNLNGDGGAYEFTNSMLKVGVVDICQNRKSSLK